MLLLAVSDVVWNGLIAACVTVALTLIGRQQVRKTEEVKTAVVSTASTTAVKLDAIAKTGEKTHTLVNSNMGVQLKLNAAVTHRLASLTHDPDDQAAAVLAGKMLQEHELKQAKVDAVEDMAKAEQVLAEAKNQLLNSMIEERKITNEIKNKE